MNVMHVKKLLTASYFKWFSSFQQKFPQLKARINATSDVISYQVFSSVRTRRIFTASELMESKKSVSLTFVSNDGTRMTAKGKEGDCILDVVVNNNLDIKGYGACEGSLSCSTCHLIFKPHDFEKLCLTTVEEKDVLDLAQELTPTSRLGCQVIINEKMDGMEIKVPTEIKDIRGDTGNISSS